MKKTFCIIILLTASLSFADPPFAPNVRVSDDAGGAVNQGESDFAFYRNNIYTCCNIAERSTIAMIPYAWSTDGGNSFAPNIPFRDTNTGITWHTDPVIGVDDSGNVHMLVQYSTTLINHYYSRDGGRTWIDTVRITPQTGVDKPWMVVNKNEIYVVWQQVSGTIGIWLAKSTNYGQTFTSAQFWGRTGITALDMDENQNLHLGLVTGSSIYYRKSTNKGTSWSAELLLSSVSYSSGYGDRAPINSISARGNNVFMTWVNNASGGWDIRGVRSTNGGTTWTAPFTVNDMTPGGQCKGWVDFDTFGGLHVFYYHTPSWPTNSSSRWSIRYRYSGNGGATFNPSLRITDTTFTSPNTFLGDYHTIETDSQYVYALWADGRNIVNNDLYFSKALLSAVGVEQQRENENNIVQGEGLFAPRIWNGNVKMKLFPRKNSVSLKLYDVTGRMVRVLYQGKVEKESEISFQSSEFSGGIYFLYWNSGEETKIKKIVNFPR